MHHDAPVSLPSKLPFPTRCKGVSALLVAVGIACFLVPLMGGHPEVAWGGYLVGVFYFLGLGAFGALWIAIQYLTKAAWGVTQRRIPEAMASWLVPSVVLVPLVALGAHTLYHWSHHEAVEADALLSHKAAFLNLPAFVGALVGILLVWALLSWRMVSHSRRQDETGQVAHTLSNVRLSAAFVLFFAPSVSVVSYYLLMSLEPHWFSTMFAVLVFTDFMQTGLALVALVVAWYMSKGVLQGFLNENHLHDVTKMAFAFTGFWAYIYFCQFLLIWYANIPEETVYFIKRWSHGWELWLLALPVLKFLVPFIWLAPRGAKRKPASVMPMMVWILVAQLVELWVMVAPALSHGEGPAHARFPTWELGIFLGFLGAFRLVFQGSLSRHLPVPVKDPYLGASLKHHT